MRVILDIPFESITGEAYEPIKEIHITLPCNATTRDLVHAFKTIMYAETYTGDTIEETFNEQ